MPDSRNLPPPRLDIKNGSKNGSSSHEPQLAQPATKSSFLAPFLGAFAAVVGLALVGGGIYLGSTFLHSSPAKSEKGPLQNEAVWIEGPVMDGALAQPVKPDIDWWTRTFQLPDLTKQVSGFLQQQGLKVAGIVPINYKDNADTTVLTYEVTVTVPGELLRVPQATWIPDNPVDARFAHILVLNKGLAPGTYWDAQHAKVEASANSQRTTLFNIRWNKTTNTVTADRLLPHDLVTPEQVSAYQSETNAVMASLDQQLQQIDAQVKNDIQTRLAQVPADPPKPQAQVAHFGGDGSGEPTKSAARIGGGAAAGAAGGALFGSMAGNAGEGAGIGAGVGLLSGIIYNAVSKSNDKKKLEAEVADQNAERLDNWHEQIKDLKAQRAQIKKDEPKEREAALNALTQQIEANQGYINPPVATGGNPPMQSQPSSNQPTGPAQQQ